MGRDWLYKASGGRKSTSAVVESHHSSSSCMSAIFNQFRFHHPSFISQSGIADDEHSNFCLQGTEAPRNSLELPESASSTEVKEQTNLNIPVGRLQIKTKRSTFTNDLSSESCISPCTKTPNLVARLMGLDLLPEYSSPRPSSSSTTTISHHRSRSLPTTPRLLTASRHSTDNDYHHRLSLQIDKENCHQHESSHTKTARPRSERTSRPLGTDITNTMSPARSNLRQRRDSNLDLLKPLKSPKLKLLDIKNNLNKPISNSQVKSKSPTPRLRQRPLMKPESLVKDEKIKRIVSERYDLRFKKMQQEKVNVRKKKREMTSSSSNTRRLSEKQVSLPSNLNSSYNTNGTHSLKATSTAATTTSSSDHPLHPSIFNQLEKHRQPSVTGRRRMMFEAEVEGIVVEIEREILVNLVHEIATETVVPAGSDRLRSHVVFT
ncbi:hypothetical protein L1987_52872 [Smallanthus sonchifolius]|uniref:Uncharacterized protein n=1 Tax=Smallanthus sonchifolius TaxID=185202 RepID=A0ACB9EUC0_9ASTR|nr:hypothetical protein L1987_52872 [Smallanthus sonchifolius]